MFAVTLGAASLLTTACVTLLPAPRPAQLYRFTGDVAPKTVRADASTPTIHVALSAVSLPSVASGTGILTTRDDTVAYIAAARWAAPASVLVSEAAQRAFAAANVALMRPTVGTVAALTLDVTTFEARYAEAEAPTIEITIRAVLTRPDGRLLAERTFSSRQPARANRVSAIVSAYGLAASDDLAALARWTAVSIAGGTP